MSCCYHETTEGLGHGHVVKRCGELEGGCGMLEEHKRRVTQNDNCVGTQKAPERDFFFPQRQ